MNLTLVSQALRQHRALAALGLLVSILAGALAGYTITSSGVEARTPPIYRGSATIILTNPSQSIYAAQAGAPSDSELTAVPENANLAQLAMVYAWIVSGDEIQAGTEGLVGDLEAEEELTAQRRSTQPTGDERFGSNSALPIFDIISSASDQQRAEDIAAAGTEVFVDYVAAQQDAAGIPPNQRVDVTVLRSASATLQEAGSGPASAALVGLVVLFVAFLLIVYRTNAELVGAGRHASDPTSGVGPEHESPRRSDRRGGGGTSGDDEAVLVTSRSE